MLFQQPGKVSLSLFYDVICGMSPAITQRIKDVLEKELFVTIDEETWEDICYTKKISICTRTKAVQFRIIHRINKYVHPLIADILLTPHFLLCVSNVKLK